MGGVPKSKRNIKEEYQAVTFMYKLRKDIVSQLLIDFGYSRIKAESQIERLKEKLPNISEERLLERFLKLESFDEWFVIFERERLISLIMNIINDIVSSNAIYPQTVKEYEDRITFIDNAIRKLHCLEQELQFVVETLPVDINKYTPFALRIHEEINILKGVKKSDKKRFKKQVYINDAQDIANGKIRAEQALQKAESELVA